MVNRYFCPACGCKPALLLVHNECICDCECGAVCEYVERVAPESEYPLLACFAMNDAIKQWNECVTFYREHHAAIAA